MTDWLTTATSLPADALKAIGTVLVGALLAVGTYVVARIKEAWKLADAFAAGLPRLALDPADQDLGYTLVRTATDLTRALNDHAEVLANRRMAWRVTCARYPPDQSCVTHEGAGEGSMGGAATGGEDDGNGTHRMGSG